nr:Holliday junction resolvase RuvX [Ardenticatena sp.]
MNVEMVLAIDYGKRRVGVAAGVGMAPRPVGVLPHGSLDSLIERILHLARSEGADKIIVGLPLNADGSEGEQAAQSRAFAEALAAQTDIPVFLWDERYTSQDAQQQMIAAGTTQKARREKLDAVAAAVMLEHYFARQGTGAERVLPKSTETEQREES